MLTIWALGASPETIQVQYEREDHRQRRAFPRDEAIILSFSDKKEFMKHMYQEEQYSNYLAFFQRVIADKGVPAVINEYVFGGDELAESLLSRLFAGLVHPIIHLGFAIEFQQPAIVAQALAQASVHQDYLADAFYKPATVAAQSHHTSKSLVEIMDEMRTNQAIRDAAIHGDTDVFENGILSRASEEVIKYCSQWSVSEDQIDDKLVEMINTASEYLSSWCKQSTDEDVVYWTATAQNPQKELKLDFFFIHAVNLSIFFKAFMDLPYLSRANKARLLEMKGRMDLLIWASRKMPDPQPNDICTYPIRQGWPEVFAKSYLHPSDDGHLAKFVRTVAMAEELCRPYEAAGKRLPVSGDMWLQIGNIGETSVLICLNPSNTHLLAVDSVGVIFKDLWVRGSGFPESWEKFRPRK